MLGKCMSIVKTGWKHIFLFRPKAVFWANLSWKVHWLFIYWLCSTFFLMLNNNIEEKKHLQAGKDYLFLGLCSLFKEHVLLLDKICEILSLMSIFSSLRTLLLPYLILPLADCVMSMWSPNVVFADLCWSWPLISMDLLSFCKRKFSLSYFFGHMLLEYFFGNLFSLIAQVFNSPSFLTSETVIWQYQIDCFVYNFLHFPYFWHTVECHVLGFLPFQSAFV